jgi:FkbM family methyltransferase
MSSPSRSAFATRRVRVPSLGFELEVLERDSIIGPAIERGAWAEHETRLLRAHLLPGCRVVDLGANIGWFTVQAVLAGAEVHAFEPVPAIADVCERNLERAREHGPGKGVVHRLAAGAQRGTARIAIANANFGDNRVLAEGATRPADMGGGEELEIAIAPVDELVRGPVRFLKVDTQGSEWLALQGARELLAASPELALLIELWPYALRGATAEQLLSFLVAQGFTLGKATEAPYPMPPARILRQVARRDPVRGGIDLYGTRGLPFHVLGLGARLHGLARSLKED